MSEKNVLFDARWHDTSIYLFYHYYFFWTDYYFFLEHRKQIRFFRACVFQRDLVFLSIIYG
jgi:coproporphyrinogen III oxidase